MFEIVSSTATILNPQVNGAINDLLTTGFQTVSLLLVTGLVWGVKMGLSQIKNVLVRGVARRAVAFAAQRLPNLSNEDKRKAAVEKIHAKFPRLSTEDIDQFLEEAYVELKSGLEAA